LLLLKRARARSCEPQMCFIFQNCDIVTAQLTLTPFERNIEVWRQLWRVVERCDVIVQIVDARDPLLCVC
jgi:ribosome biogenesis GTPase A